MNDDDGIKLCEKCGEYTTGRLCTSCQQQEMIDNDDGYMSPEQKEADADEQFLSWNEDWINQWKCPDCGRINCICDGYWGAEYTR